MREKFFTVGVIVSPHALRGAVKVYPRTDFPEVRFSKGSQLWIRRPNQDPFQEVFVESAKKHQKFWILTFEHIQSISQVEDWRKTELCIPESMLEPLPEGTYYIHQLIGLQVYRDSGEYLGELMEVLQPGANDVYVVKKSDQTKELLIPAIPSCVLNISLDEKRMTVHLLAGLLEEETGEGQHA
ncbi:ribosome maturation factor RimM [Alicyclobacillus sp. TC]|uniref:ribosome maturation factor RimM n=1 Tax=Alicyclobacillus sp. TC TaxID=2606450 RepID=UPI0019316B00|nr:ribosome maturation factor RimM [Alicyclobacillus sp. TC]QRF23748.1 ribosome maturation factor RimM [Alicyclobacillus sp. TC]